MPETQPVWRADYPSDPELIEKHLDDARKALAAFWKAGDAVAETRKRADAVIASGMSIEHIKTRDREDVYEISNSVDRRSL